MRIRSISLCLSLKILKASSKVNTSFLLVNLETDKNLILYISFLMTLGIYNFESLMIFFEFVGL